MLERLNQLVWSDAMVVAMLAAGLCFCIRLRFVQLLHPLKIAKCTVFSLFGRQSRTRETGSLSQLQVLSTTLAATMGTGNIVGVATALTIGGAGAVFWMWVSAVLGMGLVYAENVLGSRYRFRDAKGNWTGGAMAYLEHGLHCKPLACAFAVFCVLASFGMGNMAQVNSIAGALNASCGISPLVTGLVVTALAGLILLGGLQRIGTVTQWLIPPLSLLYLLGGIGILVMRRDALADAFGEIFRGAFGIGAVGGGISGAAIRHCIGIGLRRGIFSNEAGLGSSALLHASAEDGNARTQGLFAIFEVFADTILCCTLTALVLLTTNVLPSGLDGAPLVMEAFSSAYGRFGTGFLTLAVILFGFATLIGWSVCGCGAARYLFDTLGQSVYRILFLAACFVGATTGLQAVWTLSDLCNGLMAIPNLTGLLLLRREVSPPFAKPDA